MAHPAFRGNALAAMAARSAGGLPLGTGVLTLDGVLPVEFLELGDRVLTRHGSQRLLAVEVRVLRAASVVRIGASTLGQNWPEADMILPPGQEVLVRDWRARAFGGRAQALVPVWRLADGEFIRGEIRRELRLFTLRFETPSVIYANGIEVACPGVMVPA